MNRVIAVKQLLQQEGDILKIWRLVYKNQKLIIIILNLQSEPKKHFSQYFFKYLYHIISQFPKPTE